MAPNFSKYVLSIPMWRGVVVGRRHFFVTNRGFSALSYLMCQRLCRHVLVAFFDEFFAEDFLRIF